MNSQNVSILVLFMLILILLYQVYFKDYTDSLLWFTRTPNSAKINDGNSYTTFDELNTVVPTKIYHPVTIEELQHIVNDNPGQIIRVSGDNYTFNTISLTDDIIIRTDKLDKIIKLDKENNHLLVEAGCKIKDICDYLSLENLGLECIPDNLDQTIASVCSTAEHGSNLDTGTMSDQVVDMNVVLGNGHIRRVEFDDPEFPAYATNLGSLGIVYSITIKCTEMPLVYTTRKVGNWNDLKNTIIDLLQEYKLSSIHIQPNTMQTSIVLCKKLYPQDVASLENVQAVPYHVAASRKPKLGKYTKSEVAIPFERVVEAVDDVLKLCQSHKKTADFECDRDIIVTFSGPDYNAWLSPASGRATAWIQIGTTIPLQDSEKTSSFLQDYEDLLLYKYSGRPNWTTSRFCNSFRVRLLYGIAVDYVRRVRERFDPTHAFTNDFINNIFD